MAVPGGAIGAAEDLARVWCTGSPMRRMTRNTPGSEVLRNRRDHVGMLNGGDKPDIS